MQDNELPINIDDLPNFRLRNATQNEAFIPKEGAQVEQQFQTANKFVKELQKWLTMNQSSLDELYMLYDYQFNQICQTIFHDSAWPSPEEIEQKYEEEEITMTTQSLYNELCYRHAFARLSQSFDFNLSIKSWENYCEIFDEILNSTHEIPLPAPWIWDIIDEYIYQFYFSCRQRRMLKRDEEALRDMLNRDEVNFWNLEKVLKDLNALVTRSKIIQEVGEEKTKVLIFKENPSTIQYFGYFALVGLLRIYVLIGDFETALQIIEPLDYKSLLIYSKAVPSYLTLFQYAGFCFLMTQRYREAVKIFEAIVLFIHKYKPFLSQSFQSENVNKQAEKTLCLLAISLVFYPTQVDDNITQLFKDTFLKSGDKKDFGKEKLSDKFERLLKYDQQTFTKLFIYGCPKIVIPIQNMDDFKNLEGQPGSGDQINTFKDKLYTHFLRIQKINDISSILKLYTSIHIQKAAHLLQISINELKQYLEFYKDRNQSKIKKVPFEEQILNRFIQASVQLDFSIENDIIRVTEVAPPRNYATHFSKLNSKMVEIVNELENLTDK